MNVPIRQLAFLLAPLWMLRHRMWLEFIAYVLVLGGVSFAMRRLGIACVVTLAALQFADAHVLRRNVAAWARETSITAPAAVRFTAWCNCGLPFASHQDDSMFSTALRVSSGGSLVEVTMRTALPSGSKSRA